MFVNIEYVVRHDCYKRFVAFTVFRNKNVFNFNKTYKYVRPVRQTSSQSQVKP